MTKITDVAHYASNSQTGISAIKYFSYCREEEGGYRGKHFSTLIRSTLITSLDGSQELYLLGRSPDYQGGQPRLIRGAYNLILGLDNFFFSKWVGNDNAINIVNDKFLWV